jgi:hypothetical protein
VTDEREARLLPRYLENYQRRVEHARGLAQIVDDATEDLPDVKSTHTAADWLTLRGLPAVGRGVGGAIRGTRPGGNLFR